LRSVPVRWHQADPLPCIHRAGGEYNPIIQGIFNCRLRPLAIRTFFPYTTLFRSPDDVEDNDRREDCQNGDDDQQLDEGEPSLAAAPAPSNPVENFVHAV